MTYFLRMVNVQIMVRGFSGVDVWSKEISCLHWTWFSPYFGFQLIYTEIGFLLKLEFNKRLSSQTVVFTLNMMSQNSYLHKQCLYDPSSTHPMVGLSKLFKNWNTIGINLYISIIPWFPSSQKPLAYRL